MKRLNVSKEACIGCGACVAIDGAHFDFDDDGLSNVISNENIETEECQNAISSCPTNAISYIEKNDNCSCDNCNCEQCECDENRCNCEQCDCDENECNCEDDCNCNDCNCTHCECHKE